MCNSTRETICLSNHRQYVTNSGKQLRSIGDDIHGSPRAGSTTWCRKRRRPRGRRPRPGSARAISSAAPSATPTSRTSMRRRPPSCWPRQRLAHTCCGPPRAAPPRSRSPSRSACALTRHTSGICRASRMIRSSRFMCVETISMR